MDYIEEINRRDEILSLAHIGKKITVEDRLWLATHRAFNRRLGYPYLTKDIITLSPKTNYRIRIQVESLTYPMQILPIVDVPGGKGKILTDCSLTDYKGNVKIGKPVKMLVALVDLNHTKTEFCYQSDVGLLGVSYECTYYDDKQHLTIRSSSNTGNTAYAMLREDVSNNKILYRCKSPLSDSFDSFVFSIQWELFANG